MQKTLSIAITCALVLSACGGTGSNGGTTGDPDGGTPVVHGDPPPPPDPIDCATDPHSQFSGEVTALSDRAPLAGAQVCVLDHDEIPCATADATGFYQLECAPEGDVALTFSAAGFAPTAFLWRGVAGAEPHDVDVSLARDAENTGYLSPTGVAYPDGASSLVTLKFRGASQGLVAALRSGSGEGPFYSVDSGGRIDPAMESLPVADEITFFVARPWDGWPEIEIELIPQGAGTRCAQLEGAWGARDGAENVVRVPLRPGMESMMFVDCE